MTRLARKVNSSAGAAPRRRLVVALAICGVCCAGLAASLLGSASAQAKSTAVKSAKTTVVTVTAGKPTELSFTLSTRNVPSGKVTFKVTNKGTATHSFEICTTVKVGAAYPNSCNGVSTKALSPGKSTTISVTLKKGVYEYLSTVAAQANAGMKGSFGVSQAKAPATLPPVKVATAAPTLIATDACPSPTATTVNVSAFDYGFALTDDSGNAVDTVPCGTVTFVVTNNGAIVHNFDISYQLGATLAGSGVTGFLEPNTSQTVTAMLDPGTYEYLCDVPEHAALGMLGDLDVTGS